MKKLTKILYNIFILSNLITGKTHLTVSLVDDSKELDYPEKRYQD